jgi:two-component system response regulator EvgA
MVLQLFAQGRSNKEIAKGMFLKQDRQHLQEAPHAQATGQHAGGLIEMAKRNALV